MGRGFFISKYFILVKINLKGCVYKNETSISLLNKAGFIY